MKRRVHLFGKPACEVCVKARKMLDAHGVVYDYHMIDPDDPACTVEGLALFSYLDWRDDLPVLAVTGPGEPVFYGNAAIKRGFTPVCKGLAEGQRESG